MDSIYINTLKLGFENSEGGMSLNEIARKLKINFSEKSFEFNYTLWFYSNFYNPGTEKYVVATNTLSGGSGRVTLETIEIFSKRNDSKSYIKGDAINKYIDYLELSDARKNSLNASDAATRSLRIANNSLRIAIAAVVIQLFFGVISYIFPLSKSKHPNVFNNRHEINENPFDEATIPFDTSIIDSNHIDTSTNKHGKQSKQLIN